jgi:hypothetical protein
MRSANASLRFAAVRLERLRSATYFLPQERSRPRWRSRITSELPWSGYVEDNVRLAWSFTRALSLNWSLMAP